MEEEISFNQLLEKRDMMVVGFADGDVSKKNKEIRFADRFIK